MENKSHALAAGIFVLVVAAMLAGLPKAPSAYNPISNPKRARSRQLYINRGLGHLLRVRFNVRPEVTVFTLQTA